MADDQGRPPEEIRSLGDWRAARRRRLARWILLPLGPVVVVAGGVAVYLAGGRIVSTDNAYVQATKTAITTDVSGLVAEVAVRNNDAVAAGQLLLRLDDEPFRLARDQARGQLGVVRNEIEAMRATYRQKLEDIKQAEGDVEFFRRQFDRQVDLLSRQAASQVTHDQAQRNLADARQRVASARHEAASWLANLGGVVDAPIEQHPRWLQARATLERAERELRRTVVTAPADGIVTNVDATPRGSYLAAAQAAFTLVATRELWVTANPKETDLTHVKVGDAATVRVDTYPGRVWRARVESVAPASGAEFALLPPQNASGNWIKVVQRIPIRLTLEPEADAPPLRAGMSVSVEIDTGHRRSLAGLVASLRHALGL